MKKHKNATSLSKNAEKRFKKEKLKAAITITCNLKFLMSLKKRTYKIFQD